MDTDTVFDGPAPAQVSRALARQRDNLLDWNIFVDDARHDLDAAVEHLRNCVRERDRVASIVEALEKFALEVRTVEGGEPGAGAA
jgi:hypothetical protein